MKTFITFLSMTIILLVITSTTFAGDSKNKKADSYAMPAGGMAELAKNIVYPEEAKTNKVTGKVFVQASIDANGIVTETKVIEGIGSGCDEAAVNAVKNTKFKPAIVDGKNVTSDVTIPIMFKLDCDKKK